ncbi:MAG: iron-containing alcohol dehydrogenase [Desulfurella sp.]|uniref:iron-containing alcohol dehydrogenase n=2 Tax=Desulfurella sp. TaxID=1962857 RepID=UPI003D12C098
MREYFEFYLPTKILAGFSALDNLGFELNILNIKKPLIVSDHVIEKVGVSGIVKNVLEQNGICFSEFLDVPLESSLETVEEIAEFFNKEKCDCLIAVGGGSVIDSAKGVRILLEYPNKKMIELSGADNLNTKFTTPLVVVPTTSGTGSEATLVAVIKDTQNHVKLPFLSYGMLPDLAILDPRSTISLPAKMTAATAMDALVHAIEAYIGTQKNPVSDSFAASAINLISKNVLLAIENPKDNVSRLNLAIASMLAGAAFSNSMVGIVHAIGHSVGAVCEVPHGVSMSILLLPCLEYYKSVSNNYLGELLLYLTDTEYFASTKDKTNASLDFIRNLLNTLNQKAQLPLHLKDVCKDKSELGKIAELSINDGAITFSPFFADKKIVLEILEKAW